MARVRDSSAVLARASRPVEAAAILRRRANTNLLFHVWIGPTVGALVAAASADQMPGANSVPAAAFVAFAAGALLARSNRNWAPLLPFISRLWHTAGPLFGLLALLALKAVAVLPGIRPAELALAGLATAVTSLLPTLLRRRRTAPPLRVALVGYPRSAAILESELERARIDRYVLVGRVALPYEPPPTPARVPTIGELDGLRQHIAEERLDLLVLAAEAPRLEVFAQLADAPSVHPVRVWTWPSSPSRCSATCR